MKSQTKTPLPLQTTEQHSSPLSANHYALTTRKPLLKTASKLPAVESFDETDGYVKGYN